MTVRLLTLRGEGLAGRPPDIPGERPATVGSEWTARRPQRMKTRSRKVFTAVALVAGAVLVFFEARRSMALGRVESWFWLAVGVLVVALAAAEFLPKGGRHDVDSP